MKRSIAWIAAVVVAMAIARVPVAFAIEGVLGGVDLGAATPVDSLKKRADTGGVFSPFAGYMFNDYVGVLGQAQLLGMPFTNRPGVSDSDVWAVGAHAGPRLAIPFKLPADAELYATGQAGIFSGLSRQTPISHTSWGYSAGAGFNVRIADNLLLGIWGRYNWLDQRVNTDPLNAPQLDRHNVQYVTAGLGLTFNAAPPPPPPPPPVVAQVPKPAPPPPMKKKIVLRGVNFDFDKSNIRADARPVLNEAIATLKQEGSITIVAEGHTDSKGKAAYNQKLSLRRANAVRDYLIAGGISASRISVEGYGETRPVASNATDDGRAQNRRVELRIRGD
ncbi:MAG TPA: OmpA family protein [Candidatus Kryptonia bacterium]|nr:OmpA family protein [Candidatus Kryptonia bacterium]